MEFYKIFKNFGRVNSEYWNRVNLEFELGLIHISFLKVKFYFFTTFEVVMTVLPVSSQLRKISELCMAS